MASMKITVPDQMKSWVEAQTEDGRYASSSDYVRTLIRNDQIANMQRLVDEARASGISDMTTDQIFADVRERALAHIAARGLDS